MLRVTSLLVMILLVPTLVLGQIWTEHTFPVLEDRTISSSICGDFDGDGDMDIVVNTIQPADMFMLENVDAENDEWESHYIQEGMSNGLHTYDMDGDGDLDLYSIGNVEVYQDYFTWDINLDGTGTDWDGGGATGFEDAPIRGVAHEDLDQDGDMDMIGCALYHPLFSWENRLNEDGWYENQTEINLLPDALSGANLIAQDMDGDGDRDLLLRAWNGDTGYNVIALILYNGDGTYSLGGTHDIDYTLRDMKTGDLNNDGLPDIICTTGWADDPVFIHFTEEDGGEYSWTDETIVANTDSGWDYLQTADIDSDGDIDLMVRDSDMMKFFENLNGEGASWHPQWIATVPDNDHFYKVNLGDLNGDMMLDVIYPDISYGILWKANPFEYNGVDDTHIQQPKEFALASVYPNPFNPTATVTVALPRAADLSVSVYNVSGQLVTGLVNGSHNAGQHTFAFDASNLTSGIYFVRATVPGELDAVQKVMLMK